MAIRITGMYSGLDTESIISELASAQSVKKNKLVKAQTKLSWKQDAWKALNTKIFSFYTNVLGNMRYEGSYMKKATKVSNSNAVSVVTSADASNSVQMMTVDKLAKQGYMTGASLTAEGGKTVTESTTLEQLGFKGDLNDDGITYSGKGSISVKVGNSTVDISVTKDMKISDVVKKLQAAGINASFDSKNKRFYLSSKASGAAADFTIMSNDAGGRNALSALGLVAAYDKESSEYNEYKSWAEYGTKYGTADTQAKRADAEKAAIKKLIAEKKASTDSLLAAKEAYEKRLAELREKNGERDTPYAEDKTSAQLMDELYGPEHEIVKLDADGNPVQTPKLDADGNPIRHKKEENGQPVVDAYGDPVWEYEMEDVKVTVRDGGAKKVLDDAQAKLKEVMASDTSTEQDKEAAQKAVTDAQEKFNQLSGQYSYMKSIEDTQKAIDQTDEAIAANREYYKVDANGDPVLDVAGNLQPTDKPKNEITAYFDAKIAAAEKYLDDVEAAESAGGLTDAQKAGMATKVDGRDAEIHLNNVKYTNSTNTFEINGLTITAQQETGPDEEITLTTSEDTEGIYDMIKNFFTEYNKLIIEMDSLYNADSSKGYEPLLSEEKAGLADSEIEEWEKKIKDSLLRRDSTLRDVTDAMKTAMLQGATVNGKTMYLSDFGINTLGFFNAADNEKGAYHINGDKDDATVANEDDLLRAMIASDPASVQKFFSGLSKNLYETLTDKMKAIKDTSSAFTVYNDKTMQKEYDDYKDKISKEETKLNNLIDSWYSKFSAMETAMAKLQSKNNAVSSMFGG